MRFLVTGGTGFIGRGIIRTLLKGAENRVTKVTSFSRRWDSSEQLMREMKDDRLRVINGDIADEYTLGRAMDGVDFVIHAAAYKSVPSAEYNGLEAYRTNVQGTVNVIKAAIDNDVFRVLFISSDKACDAVNLYGRTKALGESLVISANNYGDTRFSVARYGNVLGSTGSVLPFFVSLLHGDKVALPITNPKMTRYWFLKEDAINFVLNCLWRMAGGEVFIPRLKSSSMEDFVLAFGDAVGVKTGMDVVGGRPGEKIHELMISINEAPRTVAFEDWFIIKPPESHWQKDIDYQGTPFKGELYSSYNAERLSIAELAGMIQKNLSG